MTFAPELLVLFFSAGLGWFVVVQRRIERTADRMEAAVSQLGVVMATRATDAAADSKAARSANREAVSAMHRMEAADAVVAVNLADSVSRADATNGLEGAAADAALRTGDSAEAIHERQDAAQ